MLMLTKTLGACQVGRNAGRVPWFRRLVAAQIRWSAWLDSCLPLSFQIDGNRDFLDHLVPQYLKSGSLVYDVGGGKNPAVSVEWKRQLCLRITGIDIDGTELAAAPAGSYDAVICVDIAAHRGQADGDLVICQALLEHVPDTEQALEAIASLLKPGGRALLFVPCRNAVYARLNLLLPERFKRLLLFSIFPEMSRDHGFRAYYDQCTPRSIETSAKRYGLTVERRFAYFRSDYFRFFFPAHLAWRAWIVLFRSIAGDRAAETFTMVLRKEL
jgi:SAM-dependent methyltransferase